MKIYKKAILPLGFKANALASGIKKSGKLDLALIYSDLGANTAARFTVNKLPAAPVKLDRVKLKRNKTFKAVIINSGNANCFTGEQGIKDAQQIISELSKALKINKQEALIASTGIIGKRLPVIKIKKAVVPLVEGLSVKGINKVKEAILTTDTFTKQVSVRFKAGNKTVTICGIAKGAGMIAPDLATMLCFILSDVNIGQPALNKALGICIDNSFNCITVDGCMSTNDSVFLLANAAAENKQIKKGKYFDLFVKALNIICCRLAKMIVSDAEGASKFIEIKVKRAASFSQARELALAIANSNLFKTAMYGENPNFGRIVAAAGSVGLDIEEKDLKIKVSPLSKKEISVEVDIARGKSSCAVYTSDLTPKYIKINAEYN